jgi:rhomboid protease GluP
VILFGASGAYPVFVLDRWWTVLSASYLHGSLLHILFNLMWIRQLASAVGELYGPGRMVIIYTAAGAVGFTASSFAGEVFRFVPIRLLQGGDLTVGASAPIFGLLGALVYYGRRTGSTLASSQAWTWAIAMFVFGLIMPGIDNYAHAGGFAGGFLAGRWLDPLKPERIDHLLGAVICLGVSILAVVASVVHWIVLTGR